MKQIGVFFAEGYEEIEALAVVDICRRCGITVDIHHRGDDGKGWSRHCGEHG